MLVATCWHITMVLESGRRIKPRGAALHDSTGRDWPKNSVLIMPFERTGEVLKNPDKEAKRWSATPENVHRGVAEQPPRALSAWRRVGCVEKIDYERYGEHADRYTHTFDSHGDKGDGGPISKMLLFETGIPHPVLYSLNGKYRLELPPGFQFNWRGFVWP